MNYLLRNNVLRPRNTFKLPIAITAVFLIFVFAVNTLFPSFFFSFFGATAKPFWNFRNFFLNGPFLFLKNKGELIKENNDLKRKLLQLNLGKEFVDNKASNVAEVISRPPQSPYDILVIEAQSDHLGEGQIVFSPEGIVLGNIIEVSGNIAKVSLFSSGGRETAAHTQNLGELVLEGRGGGNFFTKVPKDYLVNIGDDFYLPSYKDKILATVISIEENDQDSFKKIYLSYPLNMFEMEWVVF
ncbi:MAG TPA: rod shape-determining protein MreC [Candidatus Paceibacterota bacterium]